MIPSQVNRLRAFVIVALSLACAPGSGAKRGSESTTVTSAQPAAAAATPVNDSTVTRADLSRIQGRPDAPLWVIEVSDFQCPFGKEWHDQTYTAFRDEFIKSGKVRMAYVNFPIGSHVYAWPAAESAMCAGAQGKFWEMHDGLFATQTRWESMSSPSIVFDSLAQAVNLDMPRWRDCVSSGKMKGLIQGDHDRASKAGATGTPTFMIGDKILVGAQPIEYLRRAIDSAMAKNKKTTP